MFDFDSQSSARPRRAWSTACAWGHQGPCFAAVAAEHRAYVAALAAGLKVETLPALESFPDSVFVEDPAFVVPEGAILLGPARRAGSARPRRSRRRWAPAFRAVLALDRGFADGGDILMLPDELLIGLSGRTDRVGAERFAALAGERAAACASSRPRRGCSISRRPARCWTRRGHRHAAARCRRLFDGFEVVETPAGEEKAANLLRLNETILIGAGFREPRRCWRRAATFRAAEATRSRRSTPAFPACRCDGRSDSCRDVKKGDGSPPHLHTRHPSEAGSNTTTEPSSASVWMPARSLS